MTKFEKDLLRALDGDEIAVLKERKAELKNLMDWARAEKNGFRRACIIQEYNRLKSQYDEIDSYF